MGCKTIKSPVNVEITDGKRTKVVHTNRLQHRYVSLCVGGSKGKVGIQISCIPESRDTSCCILGEIYP